MAVMVMGGRLRGGWGATSCLVTVITLLAILELHNMVGVAGTQMPRGRLLQNCFKDQNEISKCLRAAHLHGIALAPYPILSPPEPAPGPYSEAPLGESPSL
ncbi:hypothetical protein CY35_05G009500 [Sphagnum magellanicum]|nr:hypothetical protein CY35_05G009500 [Sphagnum magellanicum]KAH9561220.1 hypothetical protein CY35_05G009500 [Sphagnum magellanicum]